MTGDWTPGEGEGEREGAGLKSDAYSAYTYVSQIKKGVFAEVYRDNS